MDTLTAAQVARMLNISERTLARWRTSNPPTGPAFVTIGNAIRYPREAIVDWIEQQIVMPEPQ